MFHSHPDNLWARINSFHTPLEVLHNAFGGLQADILVYGHYHHPHMLRLNGKLLLNVASVDSHTNLIPDTLTRFTILESFQDRTIINQYTLPYDIKSQEKIDQERNVPMFPE
jgi:predicted phosphodiesterase